MEKSFQDFYLTASQSVFLITPMIAFTAVALASFLLDEWFRKLAASLILYVALFGLLYLLYPGYSTLQKVYNPLADTPSKPSSENGGSKWKRSPKLLANHGSLRCPCKPEWQI